MLKRIFSPNLFNWNLKATKDCPVDILIGRNGTGKTSLLNSISSAYLEWDSLPLPIHTVQSSFYPNNPSVFRLKDITTAVEKYERCILIIDDAELYLDIDQQKEFIPYLLKVNPNCQLVLSTNSPTIYYSGYTDYVTRISNIKLNGS
jgi:predicted ATP-dependent endonuclease of OLD family